MSNRVFSRAEVDEAVALIKERRSDLWAQFTKHELNGEGYADIKGELHAILKSIPGLEQLSDRVEMMFAVRTRVRIEANLPI